MAVIARMRRQKYLLYNLSSKVFVSPQLHTAIVLPLFNRFSNLCKKLNILKLLDIQAIASR